MLKKDEIYEIDPTLVHLECFVNRIDECRKFTSTAESHPKERNNFLVFYGSTGIGKSWLMYRLLFECKKRRLTVVRLRLEDDRINDSVRMMAEIIEQIGKDKFESWVKVQQRWNSISLGTEFDIATSSTINVANERDVTIQGDAVAGNKYLISGDIKTSAQKNPEDYKSALTQNFLKSLSELLQREPVIFLLDNLDSENLASQTREWILENLLDKPRAAKGYGVLAVITSKKELDSSFYFDTLQYDTASEEIFPLERDHIVEYMRVRKIPESIIERDIDTLVQKTQGIPQKVVEEISLKLSALKTMSKSSTGRP